MKPNKVNILSLFFLSFVAILYALPNLIDRFKLNNLNYYFPGKTVNLGLDLRGGSYLLLKADINDVLAERLLIKAEELKIQLRKKEIRYKNLKILKNKIIFSVRNISKENSTLKNLKDFFKDYNVNLENNIFTIQISENGMDKLIKTTMDQAIEIVRRRIDESGTKEPLIQQQGKDRILVQLPGLDDPERIKKLLGKTAKLSFRFTHPNINYVISDSKTKIPPGYILLKKHKSEQDYIIVQKRVMISGEDLTDARPGFDQDGSPAVMFTLTTSGGKKFGKISGQNIGKAFAIVLDNEVISAPIIQAQIFSNGQITGNFSSQEANDLALILRAGALPVPLSILEERTVGPGLGSDSISAGKFASVLAIISVIIFMILVYGIFGLLANLALIMNMIFIVAILSIIQATLTLPGIAGIVLTIGMAVDANVLIFERIREEFKIRKNKFDAVETGFKRAVSTILDANLTTFIAAFALFIFGSGPIKGFSVTLMIGLLTSMYTAIVLTRILILIYIKRLEKVKNV